MAKKKTKKGRVNRAGTADLMSGRKKRGSDRVQWLMQELAEGNTSFASMMHDDLFLLVKRDIIGRSGDGYDFTEVGRAMMERFAPGFAVQEKEEQVMAKKKTKKAAVKKEKPTKAALLKAADERLSKKYEHYVKGSVSQANGAKKFRAKIKCTECGKKREVFTSDVFQVKLCRECRDGGKKTKKTAKTSKKK